uniref:Uncharacterized protein n=1 Tax=Arundo donax TaxID=35708 RepID=A0A0A9G7A9_ARUDO
MCLTETAS